MFPAVITALAFIITFIVVGLVVVAAAFSGGRRQSERPPGPTRRSRRFVGIGVGLVVVVLGVLVPALVIASAKDSKTAPGGVKLTTHAAPVLSGDHEQLEVTLQAAGLPKHQGPPGGGRPPQGESGQHRGPLDSAIRIYEKIVK